MKVAIPLFALLSICLISIGCSDSTGQDADSFETNQEYTDQTSRSNNNNRRDEGDWAEHRRNFEQKSGSTTLAERNNHRSDRDYDSFEEEDDYSWNDGEKKRSWDKNDWLDEEDFNLDELEKTFEEFEKELDFEDLEVALEDLGEALEDISVSFNEGKSVETVDTDDLRAVLPGKIRGMEKGYPDTKKVGVFGIRVSSVEQEFVNKKNDERVDVSVVDMGGFGGIAASSLDWLELEIDNQSEDGFERTSTIQGYKGIESCESNTWSQKCSLVLFVAGRFIVELESEGLSSKELRNVLEDMKLKRLEELKSYGM